MPLYEVYVYCDQCSQPHSVHTKLALENENLDKTALSEALANRPLPPEISFMQSNKYRCPHTKQLFAANDLAKAILFAAG